MLLVQKENKVISEIKLTRKTKTEIFKDHLSSRDVDDNNNNNNNDNNNKLSVETEKSQRRHFEK